MIAGSGERVQEGAAVVADLRRRLSLEGRLRRLRRRLLLLLLGHGRRVMQELRRRRTRQRGQVRARACARAMGQHHKRERIVAGIPGWPRVEEG